MLGKLLEETEILLIDAPAGLGKAAVTALASGEHLLLVANPEISSLCDSLKTAMVARKLGTKVLGVVLNRMSFEKGAMNVRDVEFILETKVVATVPEDPEVRRSTTYGEPVMIRSPHSPAAQAIKKLAADLLGRRYVESTKREGFFRRLLDGIFGRV